QALALHGGDPVDHDALGTLGAGGVEVHFEAVGVGDDVVLVGRRELEAGAVVGADFQVQREALRVGRAFADRLGGGVGDGDRGCRTVRRGHAEQRVQFAAAVHLANDVGAA